MTIYWPILLVVFSNVFYHVCAKLAPQNMNPCLFAALSYIVGAVIAIAVYFVMPARENIFTELKSFNWTIVLFALSIVGLEVGNVYMYKMGWNLNSGYITQSCILAFALLAVGYFFFKEPVTVSKAIGLILCLAGLYFINR